VAIHNGALQGAEPPLRNLGCPVLFHWSYGVGANITDNWTVTANLQHLSNIIFGCTPNQGINHFGVSLGYKF
jgi:lipid A 3-O-deacylase